MKIDFITIAKIDDNYRMDLFKQTIATFFENTDVELINQFIIVNDMSNLELPNYVGVTYVNNEKVLGVGGSKNKGIEIAEANKGRYIYMFDSDVYFTSGWYTNLINAYKELKGEYKLLGAGCHPYLRPNETVQINWEDAQFEVNSVDALSGWSWFLEWKTYHKYGKLADNSLGVGKSEDWEYCQRIIADKYKVGYIEPQTIAHCGLINSEGNQIVGYNESLELVRKIAPTAKI